MNKLFYTILAACLILILIMIFNHKVEKNTEAPGEVTLLTSNALKVPVPTVATQRSQLTTTQAPSILIPPAARVAMSQKDPYFEYKQPIEFYGKVVDDEGNPVAEANVAFSWVDLSQAGTSQQNTTSDGNGLFSLTGATGKSLTVDVSKQGYKTYFSSNQFGFEYSAYDNSSERYKNPNEPVIFVMRKSHTGEPLIVRLRQEAELVASGQSKSFPIGNGNESISIERLSNETGNPSFWDAQVTISDGGLQLTTEEFPYEAPEDGYTNNFIITNGLSIEGNQGGNFYVKTPNGYGRAMVYYVPNMPWIYVESWFNPNSNSRNLEVDPSKVIKIR